MQFIRVLLLSALLSSISCFANEQLIEKFEGLGIVNWTRSYIQTTGQSMLKGDSWTPKAKIEAKRAASLDGMRKLLQITNRIKVDSDVQVNQLSLSEKTVKIQIEGMVKNFTEGDILYLKEGICEIVLTIPINGKGFLSDIVLGQEKAPVLETPAVVEKSQEKEPVISSELVEKSLANQVEVELKEAPTEETPEETSTVTTEKEVKQSSLKAPITGLVIDASSQVVRPALNPRIINESGEEVYGFSKANRDFRRINGLASYVPQLDNAKLDRRVTKTPFLIPALKIKEGKPCIIVISDDDAKRFTSRPESLRVLDHCRVIIVTGKPENK